MVIAYRADLQVRVDMKTRAVNPARDRFLPAVSWHTARRASESDFGEVAALHNEGPRNAHGSFGGTV